MFTAIKKMPLLIAREKVSPELQRERAQIEQALRECQLDMQKNEMCFNLETEPDLLEEQIYQRQAIACRHRYLIERARAVGLRAWGNCNEKTW